jgi:hypothetical protein
MTDIKVYMQPITKLNLLHLFFGINVGYFGWKLFNIFNKSDFCPYMIWRRRN